MSARSRKQVANLDRGELLAELRAVGETEGLVERDRQVVARLIGEFGALPADAPADGPMTVQQRLLKIKDAIGALGKDEEMKEGQQYRYRGIDSILNEAHHALIRWGVVAAPIASETTYDQRTTRGGSIMTVCYLEVTWAVWGADGDRLDPMPVTRGEAFDSSDKATNKAHTAAYKVLLSELFAIPYAESDPDTERIEQGRASAPAEPWDPERARAITERWENLPPELAARVVERLRKASNWSGGNAPTDWQSSWADSIDATLDRAWEAAEAAESRDSAGSEPSGAAGSPVDPDSGETGDGHTAPAALFRPDDDPPDDPDADQGGYG